MRLPRELRDEVYEHAWGSIMLGFAHDGCVLVIARHNWTSKRHTFARLPRWLFACRQIQAEAMAQLYRSARFCIGEYTPAAHEDAWIPTRIKTPPVIIPDITLGFQPSLFSLAHVRKLEVWGNSYWSSGVCLRVGLPSRDISLSQVTFSAVAGLRNIDSAIRELRLRLYISELLEIEGNTVYEDLVTQNLTLFDRLPTTLIKLDIAVKGNSCTHPNEGFHCEKFRESIRTKCLVGARAVIEQSQGRGGRRVEVEDGLILHGQGRCNNFWYCKVRVV